MPNFNQYSTHLHSELPVIAGDLMQTFGAGAPDESFETDPAQENIPKKQADDYPPKEENDTPISRFVHESDYSTQAQFL